MGPHRRDLPSVEVARRELLAAGYVLQGEPWTFNDSFVYKAIYAGEGRFPLQGEGLTPDEAIQDAWRRLKDLLSS